MKLAFLKKIRVILSLIFFFSILFLFIDFRGLIPTEYFKPVLYLQFIPSLINTLGGLAIAAGGFVIVIILTLLFGRVYCSTICPLGTLQDIFSNTYRRFKKKKYYRQLKSYKWIRYSLFALVIIIFFSGSLIGIYLLDPFSNFGRIISAFAKPVLVSFNNYASFSLQKIDIYFLYPVEMKGTSLIAITFPFIVLITVLVMSVKTGRLFCNTVCPVGTLLGLISKISLLQIDISEDKCKGCSLCERTCKAGCIDRKNKTVDFSRCVGCYNCLTVCPSGGIEFKSCFTKKNKNNGINLDKREFIKKVSIYFLTLKGISLAQVKIIPKKESTVPIYKDYPVSPPGSKSIKHFTSRCTACHLCISACPSQVLQPSFLEYGFTGMLQPMMQYKDAYCNFDCTICSEVCPTGAIESILQEKKKLTQLGKAKFIKENCIVYTENTACGACSEHCPTKAVRMISYNPQNTIADKSLTIPEVKEEYCVGCGACEHACPVKPYKAIYVEGNPVHLLAKKPEEEKIEKKIDYQEDFPF